MKLKGDPMREIATCLAFVVNLASTPILVHAVPILDAKSSTAQVRKGEIFKIYLKMTAQESMEEITLLPVNPPNGFHLQPQTENPPKSLENGNTFTWVYKVIPPKSYACPPWKRLPGSDTREAKSFIFNLTYIGYAKNQWKRFYQSTELRVGFSINAAFYLLSGLIGVILGNIIKTLSRLKAGNQDSGSKQYQFQLKDMILPLLTSVVIGFVVLLVLSKDTVPTKGYYDSIALGVSIAILSDEQLLSKLKPGS